MLKLPKDRAPERGVESLKRADLEISTQTERLAEGIAELVLSGEFQPGLRLDEHMLAERYGVSRTPVREALRQLASTGLIEVKPDPEDRRGRLLSLTRKGSRLLAESAPIWRRCHRQIEKQLHSPDDLREGLAKLTKLPRA